MCISLAIVVFLRFILTGALTSRKKGKFFQMVLMLFHVVVKAPFFSRNLSLKYIRDHLTCFCEKNFNT